GQLRIFAESFAEQGHSVDLRHPQICDDEVDVMFAERLQTLLAILGGEDVVAITRELSGQDLAQVRLVVDDETLLLFRQHGAPSLPLPSALKNPKRNWACGEAGSRARLGARSEMPSLLKILVCCWAVPACTRTPPAEGNVAEEAAAARSSVAPL